MSDQLQNLTDLRVEVAMLKQEVSFINKLFGKMDDLINKIDSQHDILLDKTTKIESNLFYTKEELSELYSSIEIGEKKINDRIQAIENLVSARIDSVNSTLSKRLDYQEKETSDMKGKIMMGSCIVAILAFIFTNYDNIKKVFF